MTVVKTTTVVQTMGEKSLIGKGTTADSPARNCPLRAGLRNRPANLMRGPSLVE